MTNTAYIMYDTYLLTVVTYILQLKEAELNEVMNCFCNGYKYCKKTTNINMNTIIINI